MLYYVGQCCAMLCYVLLCCAIIAWAADRNTKLIPLLHDALSNGVSREDGRRKLIFQGFFNMLIGKVCPFFQNDKHRSFP